MGTSKPDTQEDVKEQYKKPLHTEDTEPDSDLFFRSKPFGESVWITEKSKSNLKRVEYLGHGHSSKVYKVKDVITGEFFAEKVRLSSGFAKAVYFASFQAPPADRNEDAVKAAVLTRNLLRILTNIWRKEDGRVPLVADALGYRWDKKERTYSIITEFIEGRGPKPNTVDIFDLMKRMDLLQPYLLKAGLFGCAWQVDKSCMTSTANFRFSEKRGEWYWIDSEPGMIAIKFGFKKKYISEAKRAGFSPLFADIDFKKLRAYIKEERIEGVDNLIDMLETSMNEWKESEIAIFRKKDIQLKKVKRWYIWNWRHERDISKKSEKLLNESNLAFLLYLFVGKLVSFGLNSGYRAKKIEAFFRRLEEQDIVRKGYRRHFISNYILKKLSPKTIHRYIMNRSYRRYINRGIVNRKVRKDIAMDFVGKGLDKWEKMGRITKQEKEKVKKSFNDKVSTDVYLTGFGVHLLFKGFTIVGDLIAIINVLGTSGLEYLEPLTLDFLIIDGMPWPLNALGPLFLGPILRIIYVAYSKIRCIIEGRKVPHGIAAIFSFGKFGIGTMAFPAQMMFSENKFTMRYLLSKMGNKIPIFGGTDSRIEHWFIRRADMDKSIASIKIKLANRIRFGHFKRPPVPVKADQKTINARA